MRPIKYLLMIAIGGSVMTTNTADRSFMAVDYIGADYADEDALRNYAKGWLYYFIPITPEEQKPFLDTLVKQAHAFSVKSDRAYLSIPYKKLVLTFQKK